MAVVTLLQVPKHPAFVRRVGITGRRTSGFASSEPHPDNPTPVGLLAFGVKKVVARCL